MFVSNAAARTIIRPVAAGNRSGFKDPTDCVSPASGGRSVDSNAIGQPRAISSRSGYGGRNCAQYRECNILLTLTRSAIEVSASKPGTQSYHPLATRSYLRRATSMPDLDTWRSHICPIELTDRTHQ